MNVDGEQLLFLPSKATRVPLIFAYKHACIYYNNDDCFYNMEHIFILVVVYIHTVECTWTITSSCSDSDIIPLVGFCKYGEELTKNK